MHKVFLGLGSNVGNKIENIKKAINLLQEKINNIEVAPFYVSKAVGYENQDDFVNTVLKGYTKLNPFELLEFTKQVEKQVGRIYRFHWGPREIDIDILFYDDLVINTEDLVIPHPRIQERDFVLMPLMDLEKGFMHPNLNVSVEELLRNLENKSIKNKITIF